MANLHIRKSCNACAIFPLLLGLSGLVVVFWIAKENKAEFIQNNLSIKSNYLLSEQKVGGVVVNINGRDAVLTGAVESSKRAVEIENIISSIDGIRAVENQIIITKHQKQIPEITETRKPDNRSNPKKINIEVELEPNPQAAVLTTEF